MCPIPRIHKDGCGKTNPGKEPRHLPGGAGAAPCSTSVDDTPDGLTGSISTSNQRRCTMIPTAVVASFFPRRILIRFTPQDKSAGFTGQATLQFDCWQRTSVCAGLDGTDLHPVWKGIPGNVKHGLPPRAPT
ncbi:MAG: hypothetical protein WC295_02300 [Methanoregula sp.]